ncbi:hypothetical protein MHYP_G00017850 [Metynnis hypsauchen]
MHGPGQETSAVNFIISTHSRAALVWVFLGSGRSTLVSRSPHSSSQSHPAWPRPTEAPAVSARSARGWGKPSFRILVAGMTVRAA